MHDVAKVLYAPLIRRERKEGRKGGRKEGREGGRKEEREGGRKEGNCN